SIDGYSLVRGQPAQVAVLVPKAHHIALDDDDGDKLRLTDARRALGHRFEDRLEFSRGASDDTQDFADRDLLLARFVQFARSPIEFAFCRRRGRAARWVPLFSPRWHRGLLAAPQNAQRPTAKNAATSTR